MELLKKDEGVAWHRILLSMEKGEIEQMEWKSRKAIRTAISDTLKNDFPLVKFRTKKKTNGNGLTYLEVERIS